MTKRKSGRIVEILNQNIYRLYLTPCTHLQFRIFYRNPKNVLSSDCVRPDLVTLHTNMQSFFTILWPTASNPFLVAKGFFCMTHPIGS